MKLNNDDFNFEISVSELKFVSPISVTPALKISSKEVALINFHFDDLKLQGEIPLLPGYLPLDLNQIKKSLNEVRLLEKSFDNFTFDHLSHDYFGIFKGPQESQIKFALESALLVGLLKRGNIQIPNESQVKVQKLVFTDDGEAISNLHNEQAIKVKISRSDIYKEINFLEILRKQNPLARIRLDPNGSLSLENYKLLNQLNESLDFDGIELSLSEVTGNEGNLDLLIDTNLTLINSLSELPAKTKSLIFKPSRDGGLSSLFRIQSYGQFDLTLSSTYESPVGLDHLALASLVCKLEGPQGLGTYAQIEIPPETEFKWLHINK